MAEKRRPGEGTSKETERRRLKFYRLDRYIKELPPFPALTGDVVLSPDHPALKDNFIQVEAESLDDLKLWLGIPNGMVDQQQLLGSLRPFDARYLPGDDFDFDDLDALQQQAVTHHAYNLLFGWADPETVRQPPHRQVVEHMLAMSRGMRILTGDDLVVQNGQTYTVTQPSVFFNSITLYGSGSINVPATVKVTANSLTHIPV
jgi:hypothetical protein